MEQWSKTKQKTKHKCLEIVSMASSTRWSRENNSNFTQMIPENSKKGMFSKLKL